MSVPDYQSIMLPLLKVISDAHNYPISDAKDKLAHVLKLTEEEKNELLPSGRSTRFFNRVRWAAKYMREAGLIEAPSRGHIKITQKGIDVLNKNPTEINIKFLEQFPEFVEFRGRTSKLQDDSFEEANDNNLKKESINIQTPEELIETGYERLRDHLAQELISQVKKCTPEFFENLVVELLVHMGYGGSIKDAGKAIGASGDGGVDGIIKEDLLGLDAIYIQAKRYTDITVGRPAVQNFVGALHGKNANKGVFITTSSFSNEAKEYARSISGIKIILVDGELLGQLMIDHNIGVTPINSYEIKKIDLDYFQEE